MLHVVICLSILTLVGHSKAWKLDMDFGKIQLLLKADEIDDTICGLVDF